MPVPVQVSVSSSRSTPSSQAHVNPLTSEELRIHMSLQPLVEHGLSTGGREGGREGGKSTSETEEGRGERETVNKIERYITTGVDLGMQLCSFRFIQFGRQLCTQYSLH